MVARESVVCVCKLLTSSLLLETQRSTLGFVEHVSVVTSMSDEAVLTRATHSAAASCAFDAPAFIVAWERTSARVSTLTHACLLVIPPLTLPPPTYHPHAVKSIDLDIWTPEQMASVQKWGNRRCNAYWEAHLKPGHIPPEHKIESFIRSKVGVELWD